MLALRLVLTEAPDTLVFDEVDAGVGGAAASPSAESLAELGERHQVLVVTHLAQVAAVATHHVTVTKVVVGDTTETAVGTVDADGPGRRSGPDAERRPRLGAGSQPRRRAARRPPDRAEAPDLRANRPGRQRSVAGRPGV